MREADAGISHHNYNEWNTFKNGESHSYKTVGMGVFEMGKKKSWTPLRIYGTGSYSDEYVSFEAEAEELLNDYEAYESYVKRIEAIVRDDARYTDYIAKIKAGGLDHCAVMGNLPTDDPKLKIEMHHGPIFNLFDICDIVLKASLKRGETDITTFKIADRVLTEHELDNIMVVMLSKPVHMGGAHNKKSSKGIFVDAKATWGDLNRFIERWSDGMEPEHWHYVQRYIDESKRSNGRTVDQGLFDLADTIDEFK